MKIFSKKKKYPNYIVALFQSLGLTIYCLMIGMIMWKGDTWFNNLKGIVGPTLFLLLFAVSTLICGLIVFGYPVKYYLENKNLKEPLQIVIYTAAWCLGFVSLTLILSLIF